MLIDLLLCSEDRERFGAPDALVLDTERVRDSSARDLIRWERECGYPIERALAELLNSGSPPAAAVAVCVWLARKQMGITGGGFDDDGHPEMFDALAELRTIKVGTRVHVEPVAEGDAVPPAGTPAS